MNFLNYVTEKLKLSGITITTINIPNKTTRKNERIIREEIESEIAKLYIKGDNENGN